MGLFDRVRGLDSFAKTHDDYRTKTVFGGLRRTSMYYLYHQILLVSLSSVALICILIFWEFIDISRVSWKSELTVDHSSSEQMTIYFDISFLKVPCFALSLDVMDAADQHQNNLEKDVSKVRLDPNSHPLGEYRDLHLEQIVGADYCGKCHDLKILDQSGNPICCNSCSAVFAAHEHMGVPAPPMEEIEQCRLENWPDLIKNHASEGCRMAGSFRVNKVAGNFHFALGKSFDIRGNHIHDVRFLQGLHLHFDHHIHHLSFGERHDHLKNPLDNSQISSQSASDLPNVHSYYIKVVSTELKSLNGNTAHTNQFSVTKNTHEAPNKTPSVFFFYDISPMIIIYKEFRRSWPSFFIGVCAIVGGVYTVAALLDALIFRAEKRLASKKAIGKAK